VGEAVSKPPHLWRGKVRAKPPHYYRGLLENVLEKSRIPTACKLLALLNQREFLFIVTFQTPPSKVVESLDSVSDTLYLE
jgi:hypothetical protein